MSLIPEGKVKSHRRKISHCSEPDVADPDTFNTVRVFLEDNQDDNVALLDTGADANFIFSGVVSALKVMRIPCKEEFRLGDGITFHQVNEKITVKLRILKKDKTYTTPYTETFFLTGGSIDGYDIVLGKRFCQDKEALIKNKSFAVMVHKQSKESKDTSNRVGLDRHAKDQDDLALVERETKKNIANARESIGTSYPIQGSPHTAGSTYGQGVVGLPSTGYNPAANAVSSKVI